MFKLIKNLFNLLSTNQRKRFYILQLLVILMSVVEILGVASIIPFMALVGNSNLLMEPGILNDIFKFSGLEEPINFLILPWAIYSTVGIWRSSVKYKGPKFWSVLTKIFLVIGVIGYFLGLITATIQ